MPRGFSTRRTINEHERVSCRFLHSATSQKEQQPDWILQATQRSPLQFPPNHQSRKGSKALCSLSLPDVNHCNLACATLRSLLARCVFSTCGPKPEATKQVTSGSQRRLFSIFSKVQVHIPRKVNKRLRLDLGKQARTNLRIRSKGFRHCSRLAYGRVIGIVPGRVIGPRPAQPMFCTSISATSLGCS